MSLTKKLFSRKFFLINLVLIGIIVGFVAAFAIFAGTSKSDSSANALAESPSSVSVSVKDSIYQARAIQTAFNQVAEKVLPSVVELDVIGVTKVEPFGENSPWRFFFGTPDGSDKEEPKLREEHGLGSGIIVKKTGKTIYILTNNHVVDNAKTVTVKLYDEREYEGKVVGVDARRDLAVVSFETNDGQITVAKLGDSDAIKVGDWAIAIGSPYGLVSSVTAGIVSAIGRDGGPNGNISDFIQTDASINKGNSGGALVNIEGEVIGINSWIASTTGDSIGLGFAIPINNANKVINDIISGGQVKDGWIGVLLGDVPKSFLNELGISNTKGAFIGHVFNDGPAAKAGIMPGDFITSIDGKTVSSTDQLVRIIGDCPVGTKTEFSIIRNNKPITLKVTITERKEDQTSDYSKLWPGIEVQGLSSEIIESQKLSKYTKGVIVTSVIAKTPASVLGIKIGDVLVEINEKPIDSVGDFYSMLNDKKATKWYFTVLREGQTLSTLALIRK